MSSSDEFFLKLVTERRQLRIDTASGRAWRVSSGKELAKAKPEFDGYRIVGWVDDLKRVRSVPLHRLVWSVAYGVVPLPGINIALKNGDTQDCRLENLHAVVRSEFARETVQKLANPGVFEDEAVVKLRKLFATDMRVTLSLAADFLHVDIGTLSRALVGTTYSHVKTEWDEAVRARYSGAKSKARSASENELRLKEWIATVTSQREAVLASL